MPVRRNGQVIAAVNLASHTFDEFSLNTRFMVEAIMAQIGDVIARLRAEEQLRQTTEQLSLLLEHLPVIPYTSKAEGDFAATYISSTVTAIAGYAPKDFTENPSFWPNHIHPDDKPLVLEKMNLLVEKETQEIEYRWQVADGSYKWFLDMVRLVKQSDGTHSHLVGTWHDITKRKQMEQALRESEQTLSAVLNASTETIAMVELDGTCVIVNPAGAARQGASVDEITGQCAYDFLPPDVAERRKTFIDTVFRTGENLTFEDQRAGMWFESNCYPVFNEDGGVVTHVVMMARDITKRKQAEEALRDSEERYRRIIETANEGIWSLDAENITTFVNQNMAEMLGYTEQEMLGKPLFAFMDEEWQKQATRKVEHRRQGIIEQHDFKFRCKNGIALWAILNTRPLFDKTGQYAGAFAMVTDITERKLMEEALRDSEERFELAMRGASDGLWDWNLETNQVYYSPRWKQMLGYAEHEISNHFDEWNKRIHPDDLAQSLETVNRYLKKEIPALENHHRLQHKDGHYIWVLGRGIAIWNEQGEPIRMVGTNVDMTALKQVEEELRQQQALLRLVIESAPQFVFWKDTHCRYLGCNQKAAQAAGFSQPEQIIGKTDFELPWAAEKSALFQAEDRRVMESNTPEYHTIDNIVLADGKQFWVDTNKIPLHDASGTVIGILGMVEDITERKQAEEQLQESEARLAETQRIANFGNWKWNIKSGVVEWSEEVFKHFGLSYVSTHQVSMETFVNAVHPDDRGYVQQHIEQTLYQKQPYQVEFRIVCPDGTVRHLQSFGEALYDTEGKPTHMLGTSQDMTERRQAELDLQQSKVALEQANLDLNQLKTTLDLTLDAIFIHGDEDIRFFYVNQGAVNSLGYTEEELLQMTPLDISPEYEVERLNELVAPLRQGCQPSVVFQTVHRHKNATLIPVEIFLQYISVEGQKNRFVAVARDITERKQAEVKLQQAKEAAEVANRAKSTFLANMSHELRTPLNAILGYTQIFQRDKTFNASQQEGIAIIHRNGEYLLTLINDILELSKIEAGKLELYPADFRLDEFLTGIVELFRMRAEQKSICFNYQPLTDLPRVVHADEKRLRQILINFLSNAVKFTQQGEVTLKVAVVEQEKRGERKGEREEGPIPNSQFPITKIRFQVEDTGIGIASEEQDKIFLPFQQVGDVIHKAAGTGLGLSITKKLVYLMGGDIHLESVPEQGSSFWIELEVPAVEATLPKPTEKPNIIGFEGIARKILVVDDECDNSLVLIKLLKPLGFNVREVCNGLEAVEVARHWQPEIILMDLIMPEIDGFEATRRIKQLSALKTVIIVAVSASVFKYYQQKSLEAGCDDFIAKPIHIETLLECLQKHLNLKWVYAQNDRAATREYKGAMLQSDAPIKGPNVEQATILCNLTLRGDIDGIIEYVKQLEQTDEQLAQFAQKIYQLTDQLAIKQIREIAKHYMDSV
jgi:PAS domain S-box-containing protein